MNIDEPPSDEFPDPEKDEGADEEENEVMEGTDPSVLCGMYRF